MASMQQNAKQQKNKPRERRQKPLTADYLFNAGGYYLQRYSSSVANFKSVLWRKARRRDWGDHHEDYVAAWIDDVAARYLKMGALDDESYADNKVRTLRRSGRSRAWISRMLRSKGLDEDLIKAALARHEAVNAGSDEWAAAVRHAQRRHLGPFRRVRGDEKPTPQVRNRELSSMARAGFSYGIARKIIDADSPQALEGQEPG